MKDNYRYVHIAYVHNSIMCIVDYRPLVHCSAYTLTQLNCIAAKNILQGTYLANCIISIPWFLYCWFQDHHWAATKTEGKRTAQSSSKGSKAKSRMLTNLELNARNYERLLQPKRHFNADKIVLQSCLGEHPLMEYCHSKERNHPGL